MGEHDHGNRIFPHRPDPRPPTLSKVAVGSVPYGESISHNGRTVVAAYEGERLVCVAPTAEEARRKYREVLAREQQE